MSAPLVFDSATPRFGLPLLFAGQAQKEVFVNEALALTDALLHCAIEGILGVPPITPSDGANWLVGTSPSGAFAGHEGQIACRQAGNWLFVVPRDGMRLLNRATGQDLRYLGSWKAAVHPPGVSGGTVIDSEARSAIGAIVAAMESAGLIAAS